MGGDNDFNVQAMITRLMWTIWTSLSAVRDRPLNLITYSPPYQRGMLYYGCRTKGVVTGVHKALRMSYALLLQMLEAMSSPRFCNTHLPYNIIGPTLEKTKPKVRYRQNCDEK